MTARGDPPAAVREALVAQYEALRDGVLTARGLGSRVGLVLLRRAGLAAWLEAWGRGAAAPDPKPPEPRRPETGGTDAVHADVVHVLVSMALSGLEEGPP